METILSGIIHAFSLILSFDRELYNIVFLSLKVSGSALLLATFIGLPIGSAIGLRKFLGRDFIISLLNTFMGLPPVVVGLVLYLILSRSGPLGFLGHPIFALCHDNRADPARSSDYSCPVPFLNYWC